MDKQKRLEANINDVVLKLAQVSDRPTRKKLKARIRSMEFALRRITGAPSPSLLERFMALIKGSKV